MSIELDRDILVDLGGWAVLKEARGLVEANRVKTFVWEDKSIRGEVMGAGGQVFRPRLNLRSLTFAENRCNCHVGRRGNVCAHAIALCLASMEKKDSVEPEEPNGGFDSTQTEVSEDTQHKEYKLQTLVMCQAKGVPGRLVLLLPPNLAIASKKDRISLRVELELATGSRQMLQSIDRGRAYWLESWDQKLGGYVESLCGGKLHSNLQVTRSQLRDMLHQIKGKGFVAWLKTPTQAIEWRNDQLPGVHQELIAAVKPAAEKTVAKPIQREKRTSKNTIQRSLFRPASESTARSRVQVDGSPNYLSISLPSREDPSHFEIVELLRQWRFKLEPSNGKWWLRDSHHVMNFLADHLSQFKEQYQAEFSDNFRQRLADVEPIEIKVDVTPARNGFEVNLGLSGGVSANELNEQLAKGRRFFKKGKQTLLIDQKQLKTLDTLSSKLNGSKQTMQTSRVGMKLNASAHDLCDWEEILEQDGVNWTAPEEWKSRSAAIRNLSKLQEAPVEASLDQRLRLYQKIGVAWLYHLYRNQLGGILADEMGLGKTVQAIALMTVLHQRQSGKPSLVVCPAGLVGNWLRELSQFAPQLKAYAHHGAKRSQSAEILESANEVVITSYSTLARDKKLFQAVDWNLVLADEAQHIKNRRTQHAKSLKALIAEGRFLLTGTPIENSIEDLISLFEFLMPGYLKKAPSSVTHPDDRKWHQERIRDRAAHYILRRTKQQVAPELPEKLEQVIYCDMEQQQKELYNQFRRKSHLAIEKLEGSGASEGRVKMAAFTELLRLRQMCADPRILNPELEPSVSCKLGVFRELLQESLDGGHRMLVFSQFVSVLQLLKNELNAAKLPFAYIDGKTKDRLAEADRFNQNSDIPVFLISLKAGGTGLNLTGADTVVHFDPWWNPAAEAQATDRAHRIGQTKKVTAFRLIVSGTVEEKVQVMQEKKRNLLNDLFDESAEASAKFELNDIKSLLED